MSLCFRGLPPPIHTIQLEGHSKTLPRPVLELEKDSIHGFIKLSLTGKDFSIDAKTLLKAVATLTND